MPCRVLYNIIVAKNYVKIALQRQPRPNTHAHPLALHLYSPDDRVVPEKNSIISDK